MTQIFFHEIDRLKRLLLTQGSQVQSQVDLISRALLVPDLELFKKVFKEEKNIDLRDISLQEECFKILALYQPVAFDLRFLISLLKFNNDLERISDLCAAIAKRSKKLLKLQAFPLVYDCIFLSKLTQAMLAGALDALVKVDTAITQQVFRDEKLLNQQHKANSKQIQEEIRKNPEQVEALIHQLVISRHFERIGDLATNLAEEVIYLVNGEIVRHQEIDWDD